MNYSYFHEQSWRDGERRPQLRPGQVIVHENDGCSLLYDLSGLGDGVFTKFARWFEAAFDVTLTVDPHTRGAEMTSEPTDYEEDE